MLDIFILSCKHPQLACCATIVIVCPEHCTHHICIGNANATVETARECGMAVVAVAGRTPVYELTAADLVVRHHTDSWTFLLHGFVLLVLFLSPTRCVNMQLVETPPNCQALLGCAYYCCVSIFGRLQTSPADNMD